MIGQTEYENLVEKDDAGVRYFEGKSLNVIIVPKSYLTEEIINAGNFKDAFAKKAEVEIKADTIYANGNYYYANAVLANILYQNLNREFTAIAYINDGGDIRYTAVDLNNSRSIAYVASAALADDNAEYSDEQKTILDKFIQLAIAQKSGVTQSVAEEQIESGEKYGLTLGFAEDTVLMEKGEKKALKLNIMPAINLYVKWSSNNPAVASIDQSGTVNAVSAGDAIITANVYGKEVSLDISVMEKYNQVDALIDYDMSVGLTTQNMIDMFGTSELTILSAKSTEKAFDIAVTDNRLALTKEGEPFVADGNAYEVLFETDNGTFLFENFIPITKIIYTAEDLKYFNVNNNAKDFSQAKTFDGYYVLANDIEKGVPLLDNGTGINGISHLIDGSPDVNAPGKTYYREYGLTGTFDGRGHTVKGMTFKVGGLFGLINGTVKDVAFVGSELYGLNATTMAFNVYDDARFENVYIEVVKQSNHIDAAGFAYRVSHQMSMNNVIVKAIGLTNANRNYGSFAISVFGGEKNAELISWQNVYVISSIGMTYGTGNLKADASNQSVTEGVYLYTGVKRYGDEEEMKADVQNDYSSFESTHIWSIQDGIPVWTGVASAT